MKCKGKTIILVLYVDDLLLTGDHTNKIAWLATELEKKFDMTRLGLIRKYLGIEFTKTDRGLLLHQTSYAQSILTQFGMAECNPCKVPLPDGTKLRKETNTPLVSTHLYCRLVGKLMFLTNTRPDLALLVKLVSRFMQSPQQAHMNAVKSILRYLNGTASLGLCYEQADTVELLGFSDADWGGDLDQRKSTGGFLFSINGTPITWSSRKQSCVALSSTESEYRALVEATKEAIWIKDLLIELGFLEQNSTTIFCDNQSSIKISKNPIYHSKTKHFEIHLHFVRDMVKKKAVQIVYIPTGQQAADIFTKALGRIKFETCRDLLKLIPSQ